MKRLAVSFLVAVLMVLAAAPALPRVGRGASLHAFLLGDDRYLRLPNYRPGVSSLSYYGLSLGLTFATRGPL